jgi:hypothetical protein
MRGHRAAGAVHGDEADVGVELLPKLGENGTHGLRQGAPCSTDSAIARVASVRTTNSPVPVADRGDVAEA